MYQKEKEKNSCIQGDLLEATTQLNLKNTHIESLFAQVKNAIIITKGHKLNKKYSTNQYFVTYTLSFW